MAHRAGGALTAAPIEQDDLRLAGDVLRELSIARLFEESIRNGEAVLSADGTLITRTGRHTGRSPNDRYVVEEPGSSSLVWWGPVNRPLSEAAFGLLERRVREYIRGHRVYVRHALVGADPAHRRTVRVITERAWHNLFAHYLFLRPASTGAIADPADITVIDLPGFHADPAELGTRTETVIALHLSRRLLLIGGTAYAGEMKKGVFTVMNHLLPEVGVLPMHCAANVGPDGDVALFFGLSGTGKTSLSTVPARTLVGDDEHGWSPDGIFNFEGGCYAKLIRLSPATEPEIYRAARRFGSIAENVAYDEGTREIDFDSDEITENTRGAYPLGALSMVSDSGRAAEPRHVLYLAADAFGVLPPISRLTTEQALYHFLSGYTAKLAGTEVGVIEPSATFSACFGAPFMPRHPSAYAEMLGTRLDGSSATVWLINTGWTGGPYGVGYRIAIADTRAMVQAIFEGGLENARFERDPIFGFERPIACPGVSADLLDARSTWADPAAYDAQRTRLAVMFAENFERLGSQASHRAAAGGPVPGTR